MHKQSMGMGDDGKGTGRLRQLAWLSTSLTRQPPNTTTIRSQGALRNESQLPARLVSFTSRHRLAEDYTPAAAAAAAGGP